MTPAKRLTRQQAIAAKCKDCSYDHLDFGNWKQQVTRCGGNDCALYPYRPISRHPLDEAKIASLLLKERMGSDSAGGGRLGEGVGMGQSQEAPGKVKNGGAA